MSRRDSEDVRRKQLIDTTILVMAQVGFNATTLGLIARQAGVSTGLVAHYFGDKDGLLEATLRSLASRLSRAAAARLAAAATPRERLQAVIDANLAPEEMDQHTGAVWLAFWGQAIHSDRLKRVQRIYQQRVLSNLRHALAQLAPPAEAARLAVIIAAIIDGLWLRTTLAASWSPSDAEAARRIAAGFVDTQLAATLEGRAMPISPPSRLRPPRRDLRHRQPRDRRGDGGDRNRRPRAGRGCHRRRPRRPEALGADDGHGAGPHPPPRRRHPPCPQR